MADKDKSPETETEQRTTSRARPVQERLREMRQQVLRMAADNLDPPELHDHLLQLAQKLQATELAAKCPSQTES